MEKFECKCLEASALATNLVVNFMNDLMHGDDGLTPDKLLIMLKKWGPTRFNSFKLEMAWRLGKYITLGDISRSLIERDDLYVLSNFPDKIRESIETVTSQDALDKMTKMVNKMGNESYEFTEQFIESFLKENPRPNSNVEN